MTGGDSATHRFLAVFLPQLAAERAIRAGVASPDAAFVLVAKERGTMRVMAASPTAGGLVGLTLADARAREPGLAAVDHRPDEDARLLARLADACDRFTPLVAVVAEAMIVLDLAGCVRPHGEAGLVADVAALFARFGMSIATAFATTAEAAAACARFGGTVAELPVVAVSVEAAPGLSRAGLKTVGALAGVPRAALAARFGAALTQRLARLLGESVVPITPRRPPPPILLDHRFADPVVVVDAVVAACTTLMHHAATLLDERHQGGRRFEVTLFRSDGDVRRLALATARPTRDPATIARLLGERLDSLADPLDPGFGYDLVRFAVIEVGPLAAAQLDLDRSGPGGNGDGALGDLLDRLTLRLGPDRVRVLARGNSHLPELASFDRCPAMVEPPWPSAAAGEPPLRPLHLFVPPQPIDVVAEVPDGPPRWFRWHQVRHDVDHAEGPERIAAEWWRQPDDGLTRDYYRVEDRQGRRFWLFRHGLYGSETARPQWFIHGRFA